LRRTYQFSLFGSGASGRGLLFEDGALKQYLDERSTEPIPDIDAKAATIANWLTSLSFTDATESTLEAKFLHEIMHGVLGYSIYPPSSGSATLFAKPPAKLTHISRTPDAALGSFSESEVRFLAAVELKTPGTDLDAPQSGYDNETPVEQGFYYGQRILGVRWVVVSDMRVLRLYSVESQSEYEEIRLRDCVDGHGKAEQLAFRKLYFLFHHDALILERDNSAVSLLYAKSTARQVRIRESFYEVYYQIRSCLFEAITEAAADVVPKPSESQLLQATQRLLDRLLFIFYCEDHPQQLIPKNTIRDVTAAARKMPGPSSHKVYDALKAVFKEVDVGSPHASGLDLLAYNGELFKDHWIIDHIDLPDALYDKKFLLSDEEWRSRRIVQGVWGLHVFDFWTELNEHLLGHIFEESLSDLAELGPAQTVTPSEKHVARKEHGVFFTTHILSDFLSASALSAAIDEVAPVAAAEGKDLVKALERRLNYLLTLRVLDPACGSGAFLVSTFREMLQEYWRVRSLIEISSADVKKNKDIFDDVGKDDQAKLLREALYGVDLLPQAVEIAKLALWLRSARKGEKVANLGTNIVAANSLWVDQFFGVLNAQPGSFDLVVGNPPWGAEVDEETYQHAIGALGLTAVPRWDSWELFLFLALRALKEGGRVAFVLPDSLLYPEKERTRRLLFDSANVEKLHSLGPGWFGPQVRMGTVLLQARRGKVDPDGSILSLIAAGELRSRSIRGETPLTQIEAQRSRRIPTARVLNSPDLEIEVFRGKRDDAIIGRLEENSLHLSEMCERFRGEEMSKAGLVWICPSCGSPNTPGKKKKGGGLLPKECVTCAFVLQEGQVSTTGLVVETGSKVEGGAYAPYVDGDDIARRYYRPPTDKWLLLGLDGWSYKPEAIYAGPKLLIRQAGVGLVATLDDDSARCPQSVYIYRLKPEFSSQGYTHEFLLGALLSRTMTYYIFKRFGEIDPAKAHAKLTHDRLSALPLPRINFAEQGSAKLHALVVDNVRLLLQQTAKLGGSEDRAIEQALRKVWKISAEDGAYINGEFFDVPDSQPIRDLFPDGPPKPTLVLIPSD
jgi:N-6 DNA Methylase/TaqI-like C-terminal specificity domain